MKIQINYPAASDGVSLEIINFRCKQRGINPSTSSPSPLLLKEKGTGVEMNRLKEPRRGDIIKIENCFVITI
jgi:hypothetical protein